MINADTVSLTGGTATFADKNVGSNKVVTLAGASLSGTNAGNYVLDSVDTTTASITVKHITGSFTSANKVYDGTAAATVTLADNRLPGDVISSSYTNAAFTNKHVGTNKTLIERYNDPCR